MFFPTEEVGIFPHMKNQLTAANQNIRSLVKINILSPNST